MTSQTVKASSQVHVGGRYVVEDGKAIKKSKKPVAANVKKESKDG